MNRNRVINLFFLLVFLVSSALRLSLAVVDRDSDDVIKIILRENRLPLRDECEECFQPKVYYYVTAETIAIVGVHINHENSITLAAQLINFVAGEILVVLAYILLRRLQAHQNVIGLIGFSLLAFNPALMAASGMNGNDMFTVFLSSAAVYFCLEYLVEDKIFLLVVSGLFAALGIATKTNAWSTAIAIFLILGIKAVKEKQFNGFVIAATFIITVSVAIFLNPLSQYIVNIQTYGTPVTLNVEPEPFPSFINNTYIRRPGITSIQDGLFTFKFMSLLEYPRLTLGWVDYPAHRTSLWSGLYGSANSLHFYNSPDAWHTSPDFETTRSIFVLALLPTALLLLGVFWGWLDLFYGAISRSNDLLKQRYYGLFDLIFFGYVLSVIVLALRYRDFSTMKAIYIFPGVFAFLFLFIDGTQKIYRFLSHKWISILFVLAMSFLFIMYSVDIWHMIVHLYKLNIR